MSSIAFPPRRPLTAPRTVGALRELLERDALAVVVVSVWAAALAVAMPKLMIQDSWLSLVDGRLIARHGLPHVDTLTTWTLGRHWIDQQWGAHLLLYELVRLGGLRLAIVGASVCVLTAVTLACVVTRKLGASPAATAIGAALPLLGSPWLTQVRAQSFALPLFVAVYGLLALDARRPGRRVLLTLPLMLVWANLHGSVVLAAGLTALYGLTLLRRRADRTRALALVAGAPLCVLATPYGFETVGYYRLMLISSPLTHFVHEWQPPSVQTITAGFFASAFALVALWARSPRAVTTFERWAIALLLVAAMTALRNAIWFELAAAVTVPRLLDATWRVRGEAPDSVRRVNLAVGSVAAAAVVALVATQLARPATWLQRDLPPSVAASVARAAGSNGIVLSDDVHADWLLWEQPTLAGRVAYDVRFELFDRNELEQLTGLGRASLAAWQSCGAIARVITFDSPAARRRITRAGVFGADARVIVDLPGFSAVVKEPSPVSCRL